MMKAIHRNKAIYVMYNYMNNGMSDIKTSIHESIVL